MDNEIHSDDLEIIRNTVKRLQEERDQHLQERHVLRAENKMLREALTTIKLGEHDPAMDEDPIENDSDRYREWVRRVQDCAEDALSKTKDNGGG